ncbi:MAG: peptide deformylase [Acidobacteria bacterium]|nr:MAG: peptide deformylase [Acidobacteriota bacterium]REJ98428.1 MAG: peptide deformylase [Acidobacteriota bacterium]REK17173.1 MAG: peptide deformylase [Acidobacteriota bacterium]REK43084.1 MAG: peptide deformylase [Acidobacteriota bacterium]
MIEDILLLGNPQLLARSEPVERDELAAAVAAGGDLADTMAGFRKQHGWGRAISAPQIGVSKRIIFLNVDEPWLVINPEVSDASEEMMEIWDDCMSFPDLLVKVRRHVSFTMTWRDENWQTQRRRIDGLFSELLQHEIDHLDGILAVSRAIDGESFALQSERDKIPGAVFANNPA